MHYKMHSSFTFKIQNHSLTLLKFLSLFQGYFFGWNRWNRPNFLSLKYGQKLVVLILEIAILGKCIGFSPSTDQSLETRSLDVRQYILVVLGFIYLEIQAINANITQNYVRYYLYDSRGANLAITSRYGTFFLGLQVHEFYVQVLTFILLAQNNTQCLDPSMCYCYCYAYTFLWFCPKSAN